MDVLENILTTALGLFSKYGFRAVTMDDLAQAAGISKKTLYLHFENKEEVVKEVMLSRQSNMCQHCGDAEKASVNAIEAYMAILAEMDKTFRNINPVVFMELPRFFPATFKIFREFAMVENMRLVRENIERGMEEDLYRSDLNADLLSRFRMESVFMILNSEVLQNTSGSLTETMQLLSEHFLYGLFNTKGEKFYSTYKEKYLKLVQS